jgi:3-methylfumaryl-CoA hydratase
MDCGAMSEIETPDEVIVEIDEIAESSAAAMHGLLNAPGPPPRNGDALPPLWHWMAFLPRVAQDALGPDGHPKIGSLFHSTEFPQRMFAGARLSWPGTARIGDRLTRRSRLRSVVEKSGRTGSLLFVTIEHIIEGADGIAIKEEQDLVYRTSSSQTSADEKLDDVDESGRWSWKLDLPVDAVALFRFSALTYNSHRIHYDRPYAVETEGYPGLVVQGPYQAIGLAELCRRYEPNAKLATFQFRAMRAAFDGMPVRLRGTPGEQIELGAFDTFNRQTMSALATSIT